MTVTSNIYYDAPAWQAGHGYFVGNVVTNDTGKGYRALNSGTSAGSGGPTGTGTAIADGAVIWKYLSTVDYASLDDWAAALPATLVDHVVARIWDCGAEIPLGTFLLTGVDPGAFTITIQAAPGDRVSDIIAAGNPLAYSSRGVRFLGQGPGYFGMFLISMGNLIIEELQFKDPSSSSAASVLSAYASPNSVVRRCIFDGYGQTSGWGMVYLGGFGAGVSVYNNLFVDRQTTNTEGWWTLNVAQEDGGTVENNTFISTSGAGMVALRADTTPAAVTCRNNAIFGYNGTGAPRIASTGGNILTDHCATDGGSFASITGGAGNLLGQVFASQFVSTTTNFRLSTGSSLVNAGIADTTVIADATDIAGHARINWDIGAFEVTATGVQTLSGRLTGAGLVSAAAGATSETNPFSVDYSVDFGRGADLSQTPFSVDFSIDFGPGANPTLFSASAIIRASTSSARGFPVARLLATDLIFR